MIILLLLLSLIFPFTSFCGNVATVDGVADSSISTINGVAGASIDTLDGCTYNDGDSACNPASNEVGDRTDSYAQSNGIAPGEMDCILYTADCTGTAGTAKIIHAGTETDNCKVCMYDYDSDAPDDGDNNGLCTTGDTVDANQEYSLTGKINKAVTNTTSYWVCVLGGTGGCPVEYNSTTGTKTLYYATGFTYASPPTDLTGSWTSVASRDMAVWVEIE